MRKIRELVLCVLTFGLGSAALAQTTPPDPVFAHNFESGVVGLAPNLGYIAEGASAASNGPTPLTLTLSAPASGDTFVAVVCADPTRLQVVNGGVTVPSGQSSAVVTFNALLAGATPIKVSANLGNWVAAGVRVEKALNETDTPAEADYCNLQFPLAINSAASQPAPSVFGQLYESGSTESAGPAPGWIAQVGYGPNGVEPRDLIDWRYFDAAYNLQVGNNDEYVASFRTPGIPGSYSYTYRFSQDGGGSWTYCDGDGAGSNAGQTFSPASLGAMTVTSNTGGLVINEVDYDQPPAADNNEFVEIYNGTGQSVSMIGKALVLVNGVTNTEYARVDLSSAGTLANGQFLVIASTTVAVAPTALRIDFAAAAGNVQNGSPDGIALVDTEEPALLDALSYAGSITAAQIAGFPFAVSLVEGTPLAATDSNTVSGALARIANGTDINNASADWQFVASPTPGTAN